MTRGLQVDKHRRIWVVRWEVHIKFKASIGIWSFSRSSYQHLRKKNNVNDTNKMDLIHRQVVHTQALCFYCLISKFAVWLWHLTTDIGNSTQHCATTPLNFGTGKKRLFCGSAIDWQWQFLTNGHSHCDTVSHFAWENATTVMVSSMTRWVHHVSHCMTLVSGGWMLFTMAVKMQKILLVVQQLQMHGNTHSKCI